MMKTVKWCMSLLSAISLFSILSGCSTVGEKMPGFGSLFSEKSESTSVAGVFYTGSPDLPLYQSPGGVIVRRLPQYTKLTRDKLEKGYAHVRVDSTGITGWMQNAQLIWRLPKEKSAGQTEQTSGKPAAEPVTQQANGALPTQPAQPAEVFPSPVPVPEPVLPASAPPKPSVAPSIFNPY